MGIGGRWPMRGGAGKWLVPIGGTSRGRALLFCFPFAGGGTAPFRGWPQHLGNDIEVLAVLPPGRESRFAEPPLRDFGLLVQRAAAGLLAVVDRPFALFGHSLGAVVAYEVARVMERHDAVPAMLFVSGRKAPHLPSPRPPIAGLEDAAFLRGMAEMEGTPGEVLESPELLELLLPMLRADFALAEEYRPLPGPRLACPVTALGSEDDRWIDRPGLQAWQEVTGGPFELRIFPGNHFYLLRYAERLLGYLDQRMAVACGGIATAPARVFA
jgi:surfactin synthase thioesterase subunit